MAAFITVGVGECLSSIAFESGHFWPTLWDHPDNAALREARGNPHVLLDGDRVFVPDLRPKAVEAETGKRHSFRRKGFPEQLRLRFGTDELPRKGVPYELTIDGVTVRGVTTERGEIACYLTPNARLAELVLRPADAPEERYAVALRGLDPVDSVVGFKQRLRNLGYYRGVADGEVNAETVTAMNEMQARHALPLTELPDEATRSALLTAHGC